MTLPQLTDEELKALNEVDMTPILGTPADRLKFAIDKAVEYMSKWKLAQAKERSAWNECSQQQKIAELAVSTLRVIRQDPLLSEQSKSCIDEFLGPWQ